MNSQTTYTNYNFTEELRNVLFQTVKAAYHVGCFLSPVATFVAKSLPKLTIVVLGALLVTLAYTLFIVTSAVLYTAVITSVIYIIPFAFMLVKLAVLVTPIVVITYYGNKRYT